jgi:hypothetical protein
VGSKLCLCLFVVIWQNITLACTQTQRSVLTQTVCALAEQWRGEEGSKYLHFLDLPTCLPVVIYSSFALIFQPNLNLLKLDSEGSPPPPPPFTSPLNMSLLFTHTSPCTKLCLLGGPIRNSQFGNIHNKKPYDLRPNNKQQSRNIQAPQENDFSTYPQPLIGTVTFNTLNASVLGTHFNFLNNFFSFAH